MSLSNAFSVFLPSGPHVIHVWCCSPLIDDVLHALVAMLCLLLCTWNFSTFGVFEGLSRFVYAKSDSVMLQ